LGSLEINHLGIIDHVLLFSPSSNIVGAHKPLHVQQSIANSAK